MVGHLVFLTYSLFRNVKVIDSFATLDKFLTSQFVQEYKAVSYHGMRIHVCAFMLGFAKFSLEMFLSLIPKAICTHSLFWEGYKKRQGEPTYFPGFHLFFRCRSVVYHWYTNIRQNGSKSSRTLVHLIHVLFHGLKALRADHMFNPAGICCSNILVNTHTDKPIGDADVPFI